MNPHTSKQSRQFLSYGLAMLAFALPSAKGGVITWGTPQTISGPSDVLTNGTVEDAYDFIAGTTVDGVTFTGFSLPTTGNVTLSSTGAFNLATGLGSGSITGPYSDLLNSATFLSGNGTDNAPTMTVTIGGLTVGDSYEVELWVNDAR